MSPASVCCKSCSVLFSDALFEEFLANRIKNISSVVLGQLEELLCGTHQHDDLYDISHSHISNLRVLQSFLLPFACIVVDEFRREQKQMIVSDVVIQLNKLLHGIHQYDVLFNISLSHIFSLSISVL